MTPIELFFGNLTLNFFAAFFPLSLCYAFFGKQRARWSTLAALLIYAVCFAGVLTYITSPSIQQLSYIGPWIMIHVSLIDSATSLVLFCWLFRKQTVTQLLFVITFSTLIFQLLNWTINAALAPIEELLLSIHSKAYILSINIVIPLILISFLIFFFKHFGKRHFIQDLFRIKDFPKLTVTLFILYQAGYSFSYFYYRTNPEWPIFFINGALLLILLVFSLISKEIHDRNIQQHTTELLAEQNAYTGYLENVQGDLRKLHHDYKNIIAAIYAYAEEDDTEAIAAYIETQLFDLQAATSDQLNQLLALRKINSLDIRKVILDFLEENERSRNSCLLSIQEEINGLQVEPALIKDYLQFVLQQTDTQTPQHLTIRKINTTFSFCYSIKATETPLPEIPTALYRTSPKVNYSTVFRADTVDHYLEISS